MWKFLKDWTLPVAMIVGALGYLALSRWTFFCPYKPMLNELISWLIPTLIFVQLLLTFCKVEPRELLPKAWHFWLLMFQLCMSGGMALWLMYMPCPGYLRVVLQGAMVCLICPTATAAPVITGKLGGNASTLTTYTLLANMLTAIMVPLVFPLVEPQAELTFWVAFMKILSKVFPLLLSPFLVAWIIRYAFPKLHSRLVSYHGVAFYLWAIALAIVTGQTLRAILMSTAPALMGVCIALAGLLTCGIQFGVGKCIGSRYADRISAGQALGQKNTVLAIWMAGAYLHPLSALAPGSYVIWQNLFNSWQLWKKRKRS